MKLWGALLVFLGAWSVGLSFIGQYKRRERALFTLVQALEFMKSELEFHLLPLPELCRVGGKHSTGPISAVFIRLAEELDRQISPDAESCMSAAIAGVGCLPDAAVRQLTILGKTLGRFDLAGQLNGIQSVLGLCRRELESVQENRNQKLRSYQTLCLCAGVALVIILI